MAFLLCLFMAFAPFLLGRGALRLLYGRRPDEGTADSVLTGYLIMIGLAEAAHLAAVLFGRSFSDCVYIFSAGLCVLSAAALAVLLWERKTAKLSRRPGWLFGGSQWPVWAGFAALVLVQFILITVNGRVYRDGDMTVETVNSFLATDAVYRVNPMTGEVYSLGMPLRLKILCLPTLYGILCRLFGLGPEQVVWGIVPGITLLYGYLAYGILARALFPDSERRRGLFLLLAAFLLLTGDYMFGVEGFGVMYGGFRGVCIRAAVLLPYTAGLVLRRRYKLLLLCVLAEACIVWTFYGLGACVLEAAALGAAGALTGRLRRKDKGELV